MDKKFSFKILEDNAINEDRFEENTHDRIAETLFDVICNNSENNGITIGLEGEWGSGKSTVISILKKKLKDKSDTRYFYFDAWAHEGDPLRRIFLESFIEQMKDDLTEPFATNLHDKITKRKKETHIETKQRITLLGEFIGISAFLVPIGVALCSVFGKEVASYIDINLTTNWFFIVALLLSISPIIVLCCNFFRLFVKKIRQKKCDKIKIFSRKHWTFLQSNLDKTETQEISEDNEPSSVDFGEYFHKIIENICNKSKTINKIILVIDNLDRIAPEDTLKIWSTLQTFFQARNPHDLTCSNYNKLWIIVPYDPEGMKKVWGRDAETNSESNCSKSFFEKCFQLRLSVPKQIMSGWESYSKECINKSLVNWEESDKQDVLNVLKWTRDSVTDTPSPRQIKTYINQVGLLRCHCSSLILTKTIALFVSLKYLKPLSNKKLEEKLLKGTIPEQKYATLFSDEAVNELCGILFGVEPDKGIQILLEPQIANALLNDDSKGLNSLLASHPNAFWIVFEMHIQKMTNYNLCLKYSRTIYNTLWKDYKAYCLTFTKILCPQIASFKNVDFPTDLDSFDEWYSLLSIYEQNTESMEEIWNLLCDSLADKMRNYTVLTPDRQFDITTVKNNLDKLYNIATLKSLSIRTLEKVGLDAWIQWVTSPGGIPSCVIPDEQVLKDIPTQIKGDSPINDGIVILVNFMRKYGKKRWNEVAMALQTHIKFNSGGTVSPYANENTLKLLFELALVNCSIVNDIMNGYEIYNIANRLSIFQYTAFILSKNMSNTFENLQLPNNQQIIYSNRQVGRIPEANALERQDQESTAGLNKTKDFWRNSNIDNAQYIWSETFDDAGYLTIWDRVRNNDNKLVSDIFKIAIKENIGEFFKLCNGMDDLGHCIEHLGYESQDIKDMCQCLIKHTDIISKIINNCDLVKDGNKIYLLLQQSNSKELQNYLKTKIKGLNKSEWDSSFQTDIQLFNISIFLHEKDNKFLLGNEYLDAFVEFIKKCLEGQISFSSDPHTVLLEKLIDLLQNDFKGYFNKEIGKILVKNNYTGCQETITWIVDHADFKQYVESHISDIASSVISAVNNRNLEQLGILNSILKSIDNLKFKPDTSDVAVLKKPLLQLYHNTGEQPNKDIIKNIAVIFKIDLTENVDLNLEMIFNGRWRNHYKFSDGREESELFEIKEYNKYYINDLYDMDLDNTKIDNNGENVSFTKKRLSNNEVFHAKLQRVDANHYTGVENENIIVDYTREI